MQAGIKIRPSKLGLIAKCPMAQHAPPTLSGSSAVRGTFLHNFLPFNVDLEDKETFENFARKTLGSEKARAEEINPDMPSDHLLMIMEETTRPLSLNEIFIIEKSRDDLREKAPESAWVFPESQTELFISLGDDAGYCDLTGTCDAYAISGGVAIVADLKTGNNEVNTIGNLQLAAYGLAIASREKLDMMEVAILQPHKHPTEWVSAPKKSVEDYILNVCQTAKDLPFRCNPGEHCKAGYCAFIGRCNAYLALSSASVKDVAEIAKKSMFIRSVA